MLPIAMTTGASIYLIYHAIPCLHRFGPFLSDVVGILQPLFIFSMLFLTFCRIEPRELKPHRWHWWLLLIQGGLFVLLGFAAWLLISAFPYKSHDVVVLLESAMLCLICPTATAAAVVTRKLGGDVAGITTYTILINLLAAFLVPLVVPLIQPMEGVGFWAAFSMISAKVFPLLIMPCLSAWLVRYLFPKVHKWLLGYPDLPFYIWALALAFAIAVTTKSIVRSSMGMDLILMMSLISLVCCIFQFAAGRFVGRCYRSRRDCRSEPAMTSSRPALPDEGPAMTSSRPARTDDLSEPAMTSSRPARTDDLSEPAMPTQRHARPDDLSEPAMPTQRHARPDRASREVTAGQSLGQKNTVFAIWMGYTFMTPETAIVGGLYSIWHNLYNSWQLYRHSQSD